LTQIKQTSKTCAHPRNLRTVFKSVEPSEYDTLAQLESTHWWYVGMRHLAAGIARSLALPAPTRILDAGCGVGGGLRWLRAFGDPTGIDLHPRAIHHARRRATSLAQSSVLALPFPNATFALVTSFEVLYHRAVFDDAQAFAELARVLQPGGWLMVRVPAHDWLRGAHDLQVHTRHRYTPAEVAQKICAAGLRLHRLTYAGGWLFPLAVLRRLTPNPQAAHSDVTQPPAPLNTLFTWLMRLEAAYAQRFDLPFGLSVLAVGQKAPAP
jgi:SAM-dependent methyltransferase